MAQVPWPRHLAKSVAIEAGELLERFQWPDGDDRIYVGESLNVATRFRQHLSYNKSGCLDLESFLIQRLAGDGLYQITSRSARIADSECFGRTGCHPHHSDLRRQLRGRDHWI